METGMHAEHLGHVLALARLCCPDMPLRMIRHRTSLTAAEKQALLPDSVLVQKSISLDLGGSQLLLTGPGDFHLARSQFRTLATIFRIPWTRAKNLSLNPHWLETGRIGLTRGMISPFFPPSHTSLVPFAAVVLLEMPAFPPETQVAISLSLDSSLLIPVTRLAEMIFQYAWRTYPHIPIFSLPLQIATAGGKKKELYAERNEKERAAAKRARTQWKNGQVLPPLILPVHYTHQKQPMHSLTTRGMEEKRNGDEVINGTPTGFGTSGLRP